MWEKKSSRLSRKSAWRIGWQRAIQLEGKRAISTPHPLCWLALPFLQTPWALGKATWKWWLCGVRGEWEFKRRQSMESSDSGPSRALNTSPSRALKGGHVQSAFPWAVAAWAPECHKLSGFCSWGTALWEHHSAHVLAQPHYGHFHGERESNGFLGEAEVSNLAPQKNLMPGGLHSMGLSKSRTWLSSRHIHFYILREGTELWSGKILTEAWHNLLVPQDKALPTSHMSALVLILKKEDESRSPCSSAPHPLHVICLGQLTVKNVDFVVRTHGLNPSSAMS